MAARRSARRALHVADEGDSVSEARSREELVTLCNSHCPGSLIEPINSLLLPDFRIGLEFLEPLRPYI